MSGRTGIAWTDCTWNPVRGCSRVSEGCRNCYAEKIAARFCGEPESPFYTFARQSPARWTGKVELVPDKLEEPLHWRKPRRVFVNSMSDLFHEKLSNEDIASVFGVMAACPHLTFQVLTKRPDRMRAWSAAAPWGGVAPGGPADECVISAGVRMGREAFQVPVVPWPLPNVWLGVSVEDQAAADARIPILLDTPAAVRFVSYEPALGEVSFDRGGWLRPSYSSCQQGDRPEIAAIAKAVAAKGGWVGLDWVIVGGESGPKARPFDVAWARSVVEQCRAAGVPCFVKQLGANTRDRNDAGFEADLETFADGPNEGRPTEPRAWPSPRDVEHDPADTGYQWAPVRVRLRDRAGSNPSEWPEDLRVREFPR